MKTVKILLCVPLFLLATESRIKSLGGINDFFEDETLVPFYPSKLVSFPNLFVIEIPDSELSNLSQSSYALLNQSLGEEGKFGYVSIFLNAPLFSYNSFDLSVPHPGTIENRLRGFNVFYSRKTGEKMAVGFGTGLALFRMDREDTEEATTEIRQAHYLEIIPSISYKISENKSLDISFKIANFSFYQEFPIPYATAVDTLKNKVSNAYGLNLRYATGLSEWARAIAGIHYTSIDKGFKTVSGTTTRDVNFLEQEFNFNLGILTEPLENMVILLGTNLSNIARDTSRLENTGKTTYRLSEFSTNAIISGEMFFNEHFEARAGVFKSIFITRNSNFFDNSKERGEIFSQRPYKVFLGLSFLRGNLRVDGLLSKSLLFSGPYFITGKSSYLFGSVSILYNFSMF